MGAAVALLVCADMFNVSAEFGKNCPAARLMLYWMYSVESMVADVGHPVVLWKVLPVAPVTLERVIPENVGLVSPVLLAAS